MSIPEHIFKAYDIRGLVEGELSEDLAYKLGRAVAIYLTKEDISVKKLVVGYDMRPTSIPFQKRLTQGILDEGLDVVNVGLVSTPLFNFACAHYPEHHGGIMVTASHNPAEYNGFKITRGNGLPIGQGTGMEQIRDMILADSFSELQSQGSLTEMNVLEDYKARIFSLVKKEDIKPLKLVIDYGNGMGAVSIPNVLADLPITVTSLYEEPDGTFPNHEANPLKAETLKDLQAKVVETGADFGFALDGDADRIGLVDEKGEVVGASFVGALVGLEVLKTHPGADMRYDLRQSMIVPEVWKEAGAKHVEKCRVGHAFIKKVLKDTGAEFASELSLHLYYHDMYDVESTDLSLLYILQMLSREGKPLSELALPLQKYYHSGEINFEVEDKEGIMKQIESVFKSEANEVSHLDGIWLGFDWGWLNVRASNTEPVLRLNLEARDQKTMEEKLEAVRDLITQ